MSSAAQQIKSSLTMYQLIRDYGFQINHDSFMCCPFHEEKTPSFKVYEKDYHCFGCGAHGDVITFVMTYFNLTFSQAILKLSSDFGISTDLKHTSEASAEIEKKRKERAQLQAEKEKKRKEYFQKAAEFRQAQRDIIDYCPKNEFDFVHEAYIQALHKIEYLRYYLETERE